MHLPLWEDGILPENFFDVIICNYVLDEVPAHDFHRIAALIGNCLAKDGIVYCRGSQERALLKDLYLYGYGTYHGQDITKMLLSRGLRVKFSEIIASQLTRIFVRKDSMLHPEVESKYNGFTEDLPLVQQIQKDFIEEQIKQLESSKNKVLVWGDNNGYEYYSKYIMPYSDHLNIVGLMNRFAEVRAMSNFGIMEYPPKEFTSLDVDAVIISSMRDKSILRQIRKMSRPDEFRLIRKFNYPIAFTYRNA